MAILEFQQPDRVIMLEGTDRKGRFEFRPLEPGYGITVGNALRRILLHSLEGYAITWIRIENVGHEFSTINGVIEDVTQIILNLKQVRFKAKSPELGSDGENITINVNGREEFRAGLLSDFLTKFEVLNPDLLICTMNPSVHFEIQLNIQKGRGYIPAEDNIVRDLPLGAITIDSIHTPIKNVMFKVENYRVEQKTDYEKLTLEIDTDGSISPKDALKEAAIILIRHFMLFSDEKIAQIEEMPQAVEEFDEDAQAMRQLLKTKLVDLELSVRALNCLKAAEVETLGDLVHHSQSDLLKFRNFGKKSLTELGDLVSSMGLTFSMDISKYKLDKD